MKIRLTKCRAAFVIAALSLGWAMLGWSSPARAAAPKLEHLELAASNTWWGQVPLMVAIDKGFFQAQGLDVRLRSILNSSDRIAALDAGSVAFSNLGRIAVIAEMARGDKSFYFFANIDDSPGNEGCWARPGFTSFQEVRGKKVAANTSAEITMDGLLENAGMTEKDIRFLNVSPSEMAPALAKGDVDAACVWQPLLAGLEQAVPNGKLLGLDTDTPIYKKFGTMSSPDIMIISRQLVDRHPAEARRLVTAIFEGVAYTNAHPKATAEMVAHYFRKSPATVLAATQKFHYYGASGWPQHIKLHTEQMQYLARWLYDHGKIPSVPDVSQWENVSFLPQP